MGTTHLQQLAVRNFLKSLKTLQNALGPQAPLPIQAGLASSWPIHFVAHSIDLLISPKLWQNSAINLLSWLATFLPPARQRLYQENRELTRLQWDVRLSSTADFDCSRSGSFRTDLGARFRFDFKAFAIATASFSRSNSVR